MPLSKHYIDVQTERIQFDPVALGHALEKIAEVEFAVLMGSAKEGVVNPHSDVDIAVYLSVPLKV